MNGTGRGFSALLDHLVGPREHIGRNRQADLLRRFEIYHQLKLRGLLDRQIGRRGSCQNLVDVSSGAPP